MRFTKAASVGWRKAAAWPPLSPSRRRKPFRRDPTGPFLIAAARRSIFQVEPGTSVSAKRFAGFAASRRLSHAGTARPTRPTDLA
jgi:hypothetical protein